MNISIPCAVLLLLFTLGPARAADNSSALNKNIATTKKPNIVFILMDDLGYGDIGKFWQNQRPVGEPSFRTPNWDRMADEGKMLTQHYCAAPVCAPSRASLMLGQDQGHCGLRNDEFDFPLPEDHTIATVLKQQGYHTMVVGKWGLGGLTPPWPRHPFNCGFDEFYGYMRHIEGHEHYPGNKGSVMDGRTTVTQGLDLAYTTDLWTAKAKHMIRDHVSQHPDQPFFMYLAYDTPHANLEVPTQAYPPGQGLNGGLQWPLNTNSGNKNSFIYPEMRKEPWPPNAKKQATMIRRDDECVGDLLQLLRDLKIAPDTLVVLTSDNGPMGEGGEDPRYFQSWGPFDGMKRDVYEGGIHMPAIVWWPGHIKPGTKSNVVSGLWDWLPSFAEAAGQLPPGSCNGISLLPELTGSTRKQDIHPYLYMEYKGAYMGEAAAKEFFKRKEVTGRGEMQAVRIDDLVGLRYQIKDPNEQLRLYNLADDPHEDHNLANNSNFKSVLDKMYPLLLTARDNVPNAVRPYGTQLLPSLHPASASPGLNRTTYTGSWPWVPDFLALANSVQPSAQDVEPVPTPDVQSSPYVTVASGYIEVNSDGEYTFSMQEDGGGHLWIHDAHVINDDFQHNGQEITGSVFLQKGKHPIRVIYRHAQGTPQLVVSYAGPTLPKTAIPAEAFSHD